MNNTEWNQAGKLGILIQGPLYQGNLVETANICLQWRNMFPHSEIVFAISVTDIIDGTLSDGQLKDLSLAPKHRFDGHLKNALAIIEEVCDAIALAGPALPLPPIKRDSPKPNNINFQIAAAKAGLALVKSEYVLRIRSDLAFIKPTFLYDYAAGCLLPRGDAAVFEQRVMISWLYTLNPYSLERLPLHFSDWFHLGLTRDVRKIWQAEPLTLASAIYYRSHTYIAGTNGPEKQFLTQHAVEQYLMYNTFKPHFPSLELKCHNDLRSRELSLDILIDNFIPCDIFRSGGIFDKYNHEFFDKNKRIQCITAETWRELCLSRDESHLSTIRRVAESEAQADISLLNSLDEMLPPASPAIMGDEPACADESVIVASSNGRFPLRYGASQMHLREAVVEDGEIVSRERDGLVFFGPYINLPSGRYVARVHCSRLSGKGLVSCSVTANGGKTILSRKKEHISGKIQSAIIDIDFAIQDEAADQIEITLSNKGLSFLSVREISIDLHSDQGFARGKSGASTQRGALAKLFDLS